MLYKQNGKESRHVFFYSCALTRASFTRGSLLCFRRVAKHLNYIVSGGRQSRMRLPVRALSKVDRAVPMAWQWYWIMASQVGGV